MQGECEVCRGECEVCRGECEVCRSECEVCRSECEVCRSECEVCTNFPQLDISKHITSVPKCAIMCVDACVHVLKGCCLFSVHCCEAMHKVPLCSSQRNVTSPFFLSVL